VCITTKNQDFMMAFWFYCIAFICDAFDGMAARMLNAQSNLGKELDSLADMVSFGVLPGMILYRLIITAMHNDPQTWMKYLGEKALVMPALPAFLVTVFACYRLAKFNTDTRQTDTFLGLATPANTTFVIGLMLIYLKNTQDLGLIIINTNFLYALIPILCYLQVADIPMMKFRMKNFAFKGNEMRFVFFALIAVGAVLFREGIFAFGVFIYIICSLIDNATKWSAKEAAH
jgi:CDP-diacylglycerol---serine O-phosphatidyltransferase